MDGLAKDMDAKKWMGKMIKCNGKKTLCIYRDDP